MCSNYKPVTQLDRFKQYFAVDIDDHPYATETWPLGFAPFIRLREDGSRESNPGMFGLLPFFAKELEYGRRTYNARSETVDKLASFRDAWAKGWRCIIPVDGVYEPNYESGKAVRWYIQDEARLPLGIAGIYRPWKGPDGRMLWTFSMLTVNAHEHPVFQRMHKPEDEKRMVLILESKDYDRWLTCTPEQAKGFFKQWMGPLVANAAPVPPRTKKADR